MTSMVSVAYNSHKVENSTNCMEKPRCISLFESATKSKITYKIYLYNLKRFMKFCDISEFDDLLKIDSKLLNQKIEDWLMNLRTKVSPNSIPTMYYGLELFFAMNDVVINTIKLRRMLPTKEKKERQSRPQNKEKRKEYFKEYALRPEVKAKAKERQKKYQSRPEVKAKAKAKERQKKYQSRPENKEKRKKYSKNIKTWIII